MGKKRKLSAREKAEKKRRNKEFMFIFINGKQKRVRCPPTIDGLDVDEFIRRNADPTWLHQNEMWEYMEPSSGMRQGEQPTTLASVLGDDSSEVSGITDDDLPF